jgi:hypothetical protein
MADIDHRRIDVRFVPTTDLHKPLEGVASSPLMGRQRRDAPCDSVADQRGKHEIKTSVI